MAANLAKKLTPPKRKRANGYKMPGHIPKGEVMKDISNNKWIINTSIGIGGFGEIYSASRASNKSDYSYVIKVEPSENGPLFCEKTVYLKIGKKEDIEEYMKIKKLKSLGMPRFFGCGTHLSKGTKYRFLVLERYGQDLWSIFIDKGRIFPSVTVFKIAIQVIDVLQYIHSKSYVHADIKGANLLLGLSKGLENQVFLVDFGLAAKYPNEFKPNPKKAHNGTLEYASRDAHIGATTRRGDVETLGYNMLQWLSSSLPWEKLTNPTIVEAEKNEKMKNYNQLIKSCIKDSVAADVTSKFFRCLCKLQPLDEPDYNALKEILQKNADDGSNALHFSPSKISSLKSAKVSPAKTRREVSNKSNSSNSDEPICKRTRAKGSKTHSGDMDVEEDKALEDDGDLFKTTPPAKEKSKRSWKDAPTVVSCAEYYSKNFHGDVGKFIKK